VIVSEKHPSLLWYVIKYGHKKSYDTGPGCQCCKPFTGLGSKLTGAYVPRNIFLADLVLGKDRSLPADCTTPTIGFGFTLKY
jgi:hypothetical protein